MPNGASKRPRGRTLAEFLDGLGQLSPAERKLLEACVIGEPASIDGTLRPEHRTDENQIRARFVRFLALGGDERAPVDEKGVHVRGAWIDGDIDLEACHVTGPITLDWCHVDGEINLLDAEIPCLFLDNSFAKGIDAERLRCPGSVHIHNGTFVDGKVSLVCAHIGGDLDCVGARFENREEECLDCQGAEIRGSVFLGREGDTRSFHATGNVDFTGAQVDGDVFCRRARFEDEVWFIGARIKGDLDFSLCCFPGPADRSEIILSRAEVGGRFFFRKTTGEVERIILRGTTVNAIVDDMASWKVAHELLLDGFQYSRFIDAHMMDEPGIWTPEVSLTDATSRIAWLDRQRKEDIQIDFKPQPWEQLVKVLREMGHQEGAKKVAIAKQERIRKSTRASCFDTSSLWKALPLWIPSRLAHSVGNRCRCGLGDTVQDRSHQWCDGANGSTHDRGSERHYRGSERHCLSPRARW